MTYEPPGPVPAGPSPDERTMSMFAHLGGILFGFIPALVIYLTKGKESAFVKDQAREALNFQITLVIAYAVSFILVFVLIGVLLMAVVWAGSLALMIIAGLKSNAGEAYRYPVTLRLVT
jgi:uncharacterized Tic20 family protein